MTAVMPPPPPPAGAPSRPAGLWAVAGSAAPPRLARVFVVSGPTGGAGKTMVATALAHLLGRDDHRVVLADLDTQFGEVAGALQLTPTASSYEVLFDDLGRRYDRRVVAEHVPDALTATRDGFGVLTAPRDPVQGDAIGPDDLSTLIGALRRTCDHLVLDCPAGLGERTLAALDRADRHVVVTTIDVPGIASLRRYTETIARLGIEPDQQLTVLNKEIPGSGLTGADVLQVMGDIGGILPFEPLVPRALNEGRPITAAQPDHAFTSLLQQVLAPVLPTPAEPAPTAPNRRGTTGRRLPLNPFKRS